MAGGHAGTGAAAGAIIGAVGGTAVGGAYQHSKTKEGYEQASSACMQGRGYTVGRQVRRIAAHAAHSAYFMKRPTLRCHSL